MPEVRVTHDHITGEEAAAKPPKKEPVKPGTYVAVIMAAPTGVTKGPPVLNKLAVEFQILHADDETKSVLFAGRRVYQDYILEKDPSKPDLSTQRRWELRMLLDAANVAYTDQGFNTDHLVTKTVKITVRQRTGTQADEEGKFPVFSNVVKVDTAEKVDESELV